MHDTAGCSCPDDKHYCFLLRPVFKAMSDRLSRLPTRSITCHQHCFLILYEHKFTGNQINELILSFVPVPMRGSGTRWKAFQVDAELSQPNNIAKRNFGIWTIILPKNWIWTFVMLCPTRKIDFRHS